MPAGHRPPELRGGVALLASKRAYRPRSGRGCALPGDLEDVLAGRFTRELERRGLCSASMAGFLEIVLSVDRRSDDVELERMKGDLA